jgi:hypothetical protein
MGLFVWSRARVDLLLTAGRKSAAWLRYTRTTPPTPTELEAEDERVAVLAQRVAAIEERDQVVSLDK